MNKLNQLAQLDKYLIIYPPIEFDKDFKNVTTLVYYKYIDLSDNKTCNNFMCEHIL